MTRLHGDDDVLQLHVDRSSDNSTVGIGIVDGFRLGYALKWLYAAHIFTNGLAKDTDGSHAFTEIKRSFSFRWRLAADAAQEHKPHQDRPGAGLDPLTIMRLQVLRRCFERGKP
eukprot:4974212-Pleurochrysis_carterae.AAC.1